MSAKVIFSWRADMPHHSADRRGAQIIKTLGRGMAASYSRSWPTTYRQCSFRLMIAFKRSRY